jgi:large subunit ribosomal protein L30e
MSLEEVRKLSGSGKLSFGTDQTLKGLRLGKISKIFVSENCPDDIKEQVTHLSKIGKIKVEMLDVSNEELGVACKKLFSVSIVGLKK